MPDERHPRTIWHLHSVAGTNTVTGSTDHDYKAYRDRMEVRWRPTSFRNYFTGMTVTWTAVATNTGAVTLNINNRGAKDLTRAGTALSAGDLVSGVLYVATYDGTEFQMVGTNIVAGGGQGVTVHCGSRWLADGTKVAGVGILSVTRTALGKYRNVIDGTAATVGGYVQMWPVPGVSGDAGDGGGGVSPFKRFSSYLVEETDNGDGNDFFYYPGGTLGRIVVFGTNVDDLWLHDLDNFTTAATQVALTSTLRGPGQSGCISKEKTKAWASGDSAGSIPIRGVVLATGVETNFATSIDAVCVAADDTNLLTMQGATVVMYAPNYGAGTLGTSVASWSVDINNSVSLQGTWDSEGNVWFARTTAGLVRIDPGTGTTFRSYAYPATPVGLDIFSAPAYDTLRNCFYVSFEVSSGYIYKFSGWSDFVDNTGNWEPFISGVAEGVGFIGMHHDPTTDILFVTNYTTLHAYRYMASTGQRIDAIRIQDTTPDSDADVDYSLDQCRWCYYEGNVGYLIGIKAGQKYLIKIIYEGAAIDGSGLGAEITNNPLIAQFSVVNTTTVDVEILRVGQPTVRADAQGSVQIDYTPA